jgi:subtilisin family serine protease
MRKIIFILFSIIIFNTLARSQDDEFIVFKINKEDAKPLKQKNNNKFSNNDKLNRILNKHSVYKYEQRYPYAKNPELLKIYRLRLYGEAQKLKEDLLKEDSDVVSDVSVIGRPISCYDPSDYMWTPAYRSWLWHLSNIHADQAWDITKGSTNVHVAVVDDWFDINHPDLSTQISPHYDMNTGTAFSSDGTKENHGTFVSSFVAAQTDVASGGQLASVGFNTKMYAFTDEYNIDGLAQALFASNVSNADVISISWFYSNCTPNPSDALVIQEILNNNTIIVASAGNGYYGNGQFACTTNGGPPFKPVYPFSNTFDNRLICVSSTDVNDNHRYIDNGTEITNSYYPEVDICAPGYNCMGATCTVDEYGVPKVWPYYGQGSGTSIAAPIVAGVCALMKSIDPCLTPTKAKSIIKSTADPIADADLYPGMVGAGRINALRCVQTVGKKTGTNRSFNGNYLYSAGYSIVLTNVTVYQNANITFKARKEISINGPFEMRLGGVVSFEIDPNAVNSCNW